VLVASVALKSVSHQSHVRNGSFVAIMMSVPYVCLAQ
jgi:hypothetical protein